MTRKITFGPKMIFFFHHFHPPIQKINGWKTAVAKLISINLKLLKKQPHHSCLSKNWYEFLCFPGGFSTIFGYQAWLWDLLSSQVPPTVTGHRRWHPAPHFQRPDGNFAFATSLAWREPVKMREICLITSIFFPHVFDSFQTFLSCLSYFSDMFFHFVLSAFLRGCKKILWTHTKRKVVFQRPFFQGCGSKPDHAFSLGSWPHWLMWICDLISIASDWGKKLLGGLKKIFLFIPSWEMHPSLLGCLFQLGLRRFQPPIFRCYVSFRGCYWKDHVPFISGCLALRFRHTYIHPQQNEI